MLQAIMLATLALLAPSISAVAVQTKAAANAIIARGPEPTPAPMLRARQVVKRDLAQTCGYIDGDEDEPVGCNDGFICFFWANVPVFSSAPSIGNTGVANCIPTDPSASSVPPQNYYPATTCLDYGGDNPNTAKEGGVLSQTLYCGSELATCAEYYFPYGPVSWFSSGFPKSSSLAAQEYTQPYCDSKATTQTLYPAPT